LCGLVVALLVVGSVGLGAGGAVGVPVLRLEVQLAAGAPERARPLVFTVGGPVYCMQCGLGAQH
jgi:hypothetical protein